MECHGSKNAMLCHVHLQILGDAILEEILVVSFEIVWACLGYVYKLRVSCMAKVIAKVESGGYILHN